MLGDNSASQDEPIWKFNDGGKEIFQSENSSPGRGGVLIVDFEEV